MNSNKIFMMCVCSILASTFFVSYPKAEVKWHINKTMQLQQSPIDTTISRSGKYTFVLTDTGQILIHDAVGVLRGIINAGTHINKILAGPNDNSLLICSKKEKTTQVLSFVIEEEIDISGSPFLGSEDAPVELVIFSDFQWPYCAEVSPVLKQLLEFNKKDLKIVYKNFPLSMHKFALKAATAALAAMDSGKFWPFHDRLLEQFNTMTEESILQIAVDMGFEKKLFEEKMKDPKLMMKIQKDIQDAKKLGIKSVPTLFINGKAQKQKSLEALQKSIDWELSHQKK